MAISRKLLNPGEEVVISTRTHAKAILLPLLILVVCLALAVTAQLTFAEGAVAIGIWVVAAILILWLVLWPILVWLTGTYTVTNRRLITRSGVINRRGHDIPLSRISDVAYERDLLDRLLGCGTLIISDASTHGQVVLPDIPGVERAQLQINELLHGSGARGDGHS